MRYLKNEKIGNLNRKVRIEERTITRNSYGETDYSYTEFTTLYAEADFRITRTDEKPQEQQKVATTSVFYRIRRRTGLSTEMRLVDLTMASSQNIFNIVAIREESKDYMILECINYEY